MSNALYPDPVADKRRVSLHGEKKM